MDAPVNGLSINSAGEVTGNFTKVEKTTAEINVSNSQGGNDKTFTINVVSNPNGVPVWKAIPKLSGKAGGADINGQPNFDVKSLVSVKVGTLTLTPHNLPAFLNWNNGNLKVNATIPVSDLGKTLSFTVTATGSLNKSAPQTKTFQFSVVANPNGVPVWKTIPKLTGKAGGTEINGQPTFNINNLVSVKVGTLTLTHGTLPTFLNWNNGNLKVNTNIPAGDLGKTLSFTVTATGSLDTNASQTKTFAFEVNPAAPKWNGVTTIEFTAGMKQTYALNSKVYLSNFEAANKGLSFTITRPPGVTAAELSQAPGGTLKGNFTHEIKASQGVKFSATVTNSTGKKDTKSFLLVVFANPDAKPKWDPIPTITGTAGYSNIQVNGNKTTSLDITKLVHAGTKKIILTHSTLPSFLSWNDGVVTVKAAIPSSDINRTKSFTVSATDSEYSTPQTRTFTIKVSPQKPQWKFSEAPTVTGIVGYQNGKAGRADIVNLQDEISNWADAGGNQGLITFKAASLGKSNFTLNGGLLTGMPTVQSAFMDLSLNSAYAALFKFTATNSVGTSNTLTVPVLISGEVPKFASSLPAITANKFYKVTPQQYITNFSHIGVARYAGGGNNIVGITEDNNGVISGTPNGYFRNPAFGPYIIVYVQNGPNQTVSNKYIVKTNGFFD